jgi:PleD family two-component response regulator
MEPIVNLYKPDMLPDQTRHGTCESPSTILVIGQQIAVRDYLRNALDSTYRIEEAKDDIEGLRLSKQIRPDLIILELNVPLKGDPLCFELKRCERTSHIPIVVLTDQDDRQGRIKSFYLGADDFMMLPLQEAELQIRIQNLIQSRKKLLQKFSQLVDLKPAATDVPSENQLFLQRIKKVMEDKMGDPYFGSEAFAREMGLSQTRLYRKLISLTGYSSNDFIRRMRLQRAAELLQKQVGNVSEVAYQVGFNSLSYFAKCFKEFHNYTPRDYAKRVAN